MRHILLLALLLLCAPALADPVLKPFKDDLFGYGKVLEEGDGGRNRTIDYDEVRDINGRDEVPERRVRQNYVSLGVRRQQQDLVLQTPAGAIRHFAVGRTDKASAIVVYLHGQGGSRKQGVDDFTFGGNFNRLKNLVVRAGGLYLSPDFNDFEDKGAAEIAALIDGRRNLGDIATALSLDWDEFAALYAPLHKLLTGINKLYLRLP